MKDIEIVSGNSRIIVGKREAGSLHRIMIALNGISGSSIVSSSILLEPADAEFVVKALQEALAVNGAKNDL